MTAVADSSPLVILTKLGCFQLLNRLFPRVYISAEVQYEVVIAGAGLPGASEVSKAEWIEVKRLQNRRTWEPPEPKRRVHGGYTEKGARVIPFKSRRKNGGGGGSRNIHEC